MVFCVLPIIIYPFGRYATVWTLAVDVILLAVSSAGVYYMWRVNRDTWDMVIRLTPVPVGSAGAAILRALDDAMIFHGHPVRDPGSPGRGVRFEWEVDIPYRGLRIGVGTGGIQGRFVGLGPLTEENGDEVERLEALIDGALDEVPA